MNERTRAEQRAALPFRGLAQRFANVGLVATAVALMILVKADAVLMERFRAEIVDTVAPILDVMSRPVAVIGDAVDEMQALASLRDDNARLREERARLMNWQNVARQLEAENAELRRLLGFVSSPEDAFVTARVVADAGGAFAHSLLLAAGASDGISKGHAVVAGEGLVGRVASVANRSARVLLITDLNSRIPVVVAGSRVRAILGGDNTEQPKLIHLAPGALVGPGDRVLTSGHGGAFPPGLPVGVVSTVHDKTITVEPFAKRHRLEFVRVVDYGLRGILRMEPVADGMGGPPTGR